jgi:hypothetical protein
VSTKGKGTQNHCGEVANKKTQIDAEMINKIQSSLVERSFVCDVIRKNLWNKSKIFLIRNHLTQPIFMLATAKMDVPFKN